MTAQRNAATFAGGVKDARSDFGSDANAGAAGVSRLSRLLAAVRTAAPREAGRHRTLRVQDATVRAPRRASKRQRQQREKRLAVDARNAPDFSPPRGARARRVRGVPKGSKAAAEARSGRSGSRVGRDGRSAAARSGKIAAPEDARVHAPGAAGSDPGGVQKVAPGKAGETRVRTLVHERGRLEHDVAGTSLRGRRSGRSARRGRPRGPRPNPGARVLRTLRVSTEPARRRPGGPAPTAGGDIAQRGAASAAFDAAAAAAARRCRPSSAARGSLRRRRPRTERRSRSLSAFARLVPRLVSVVVTARLRGGVPDAVPHARLRGLRHGGGLGRGRVLPGGALLSPRGVPASPPAARSRLPRLAPAAHEPERIAPRSVLPGTFGPVRGRFLDDVRRGLSAAAVPRGGGGERDERIGGHHPADESGHAPNHGSRRRPLEGDVVLVRSGRGLPSGVLRARRLSRVFPRRMRRPRVGTFFFLLRPSVPRAGSATVPPPPVAARPPHVTAGRRVHRRSTAAVHAAAAFRASRLVGRAPARRLASRGEVRRGAILATPETARRTAGRGTPRPLPGATTAAAGRTPTRS